MPASLPDDARERPRVAPDVAVEILSPDDSRRSLDEKIALYFAHGGLTVIVADPLARTIAYHGDEPAGLALDRDELFAGL